MLTFAGISLRDISRRSDKKSIDKNKHTITAEAVSKHIDGNTIGVGCVLGTTFTGEIDPVKDINHLLLEFKRKKVGICPSI